MVNLHRKNKRDRPDEDFDFTYFRSNFTGLCEKENIHFTGCLFCESPVEVVIPDIVKNEVIPHLKKKVEENFKDLNTGLKGLKGLNSFLDITGVDI